FLALAGGLSALLAGSALAADWPMIQRDPAHSGFSDVGPVAPLRKLWRAHSNDPEDSFTTWPIVGGGVVFASSGDGVLAVEAETGRRKWFNDKLGGQIIAGAASDQRAVYMSVPFGRLVALDRESGEEIWSFKAEDDLGSPAIANGKVFVPANPVSQTKAFYAVNAADGKLAWKTPSRFSPDTVPAVAGGKVIVTADDLQSDNGEILALDETTGKEVWAVPAVAGKNSPSILEDKVIFGGGDLFAHALDLDTGKEVWRSPLYGGFDPENAPAVAYGDVFLADGVGNIYRLDGKTGKRKWAWGDHQGLDIVGFGGQFPVIAGKTLYIGNGAGWLYGLNVDNGRLLWQHQIGGFVYSGAADEKRFYVGVKFRNEGVYAFDHDPSGKIEPIPRPPNKFLSLISGLLIFSLMFGALVFFVRRSRSSKA
ncbi:MAG: PQQ-binding-like beta-propeller repeat protein, partial [Actinomycetota bacterium]